MEYDPLKDLIGIIKAKKQLDVEELIDFRGFDDAREHPKRLGVAFSTSPTNPLSLPSPPLPNCTFVSSPAYSISKHRAA